MDKIHIKFLKKILGVNPQTPKPRCVWRTRNKIGSFNTVFKSIQRRLRDNFIQVWQDSYRSCLKLDYYRNYKLVFEVENYLTNMRDETLRKTLKRFRLALHKLAIKT